MPKCPQILAVLPPPCLKRRSREPPTQVSVLAPPGKATAPANSLSPMDKALRLREVE